VAREALLWLHPEMHAMIAESNVVAACDLSAFMVVGPQIVGGI
jgi:hypothetical protein